VVAWAVLPGNNSVDLKEGKSPNSKSVPQSRNVLASLLLPEASLLLPEASPLPPVAWEAPPGNNSVDLKEGKSPNNRNVSQSRNVLEPLQPLEASPLLLEASPLLLEAPLELNVRLCLPSVAPSLSHRPKPLEANSPPRHGLVCSAARGPCPPRHALVCSAARGLCPP
jgi:hypothetical protein